MDAQIFTLICLHTVRHRSLTYDRPKYVNVIDQNWNTAFDKITYHMGTMCDISD